MAFCTFRCPEDYRQPVLRLIAFRGLALRGISPGVAFAPPLPIVAPAKWRAARRVLAADATLPPAMETFVEFSC
jgi:hypothetical protein